MANVAEPLSEARALLAEATEAGLKVWADGDTLRIRGPKKLEPLVKALQARKWEVMAALIFPRLDFSTFNRPDPPGTEYLPIENVTVCPVCASVLHWVSLTGVQHCQDCKPVTKALELAQTARRLRHKADKHQKRSKP